MANGTSLGVGAGITVAVLLAAGLFVGNGMAHVGVGNVGIEKHTNGQVTEIGQGWHWVGYGVGVQEYPTYWQPLILSDNAKEGGKSNDQWQVGTADKQELPVNTSLTWKVDPTNATALYQSVGGKDINYIRDSIVEPDMKAIVNQITHDYTWDDIKGAKQKEVTLKIQTTLQTELAKSGIDVGTFGFTYVGSPKGMDQAQQALAQSELAVQQAQQKQAQAKIENQTTIMNAQAQAQADQITAQGIKAKAEAMNALTVQEDAIKKWNGSLPTTIAGGSLPFINIPAGSSK